MNTYKLPFALIFWLLFTPMAFGQCGTPCPPSDPCMKAHPMPCNQGEETGMMMFCAMMNGHKDMKAVLKSVLVLQQRALNATAKEKKKIKAEIDGLIKQIDAMPGMMDCPMMDMDREDCMYRDVNPKDRTKEKAKPSEHQH